MLLFMLMYAQKIISKGKNMFKKKKEGGGGGGEKGKTAAKSHEMVQ